MAVAKKQLQKALGLMSGTSADGADVALIVIDAIVDLPRTRQAMPDQPDEFFLKPDDMAATALWLANQPRSAWSFEVDVRPFGEKW